jgi:zinc protease
MRFVEKYRRITTRMKRRPFLMAGLLIGLGLTAAGLAGAAGNTPLQAQPIKVFREVMPNGLTLIVKPNTANQVVAVDVFLKSGPLYETPNQRGISSLTQRVLIRGSATRSAREIAVETESAGVELTAGVGNEYGYVSLLTTFAGLNKGLEVLLDVLQHPSFTEAELEKERKMMVEKLAAREDRPFEAAYTGFMNLFYTGHPFGTKTIDLIKSVQNITKTDLESWYKKVYMPNNMVVSIVGNVNPVALAKVFKNSLDKLNKGETPKIAALPLKHAANDRVTYEVKKTNAAFLVLGYPAPQLQSKDALAMEVINRILGGGGEARLYMELREKRGLAYTVYSDYVKMSSQSHICVIMATNPENLKAARDGIVKEFKRLTKTLVSARELNDAKRAIKGSYMMSQETNSAQSGLLGRYELLGFGYRYDQKFPRLIGQVTAADVLRVARKYFQHYTMGVVSAGKIEK